MNPRALPAMWRFRRDQPPLAVRVICLLLASGVLHPSSDAHAQNDEAFRLGRWMSIQQAELALRARSQRRTDGEVEARRLEHWVAVGGQFEFDSAAR